MYNTSLVILSNSDLHAAEYRYQYYSHALHFAASDFSRDTATGHCAGDRSNTGDIENGFHSGSPSGLSHM
jgi:hypothetical protein